MFFEALIDPNNLESLGGFIPPVYREAILDEELRGVAVYDGILADDRLVGVVLFRECYQWQRIEWVSLSSRYSMPEYGSTLIRMRCNAVAAAAKLYGTFADCTEGDDIFSAYLKDAGFTFSDSKSEIYSFTADQIKSGDIIGKPFEETVSSLGDLTDDELQAVARYMARGRKILPVPKTIFWDRYEPDLSAVCYDDGMICGLLLCRQDAGDLYSDYFRADSAGSLKALLTHGHTALMNLYGEAQPVVVTAFTRNTAELVEKLVPDANRAVIKKALCPCHTILKNVTLDKTVSLLFPPAQEKKQEESSAAGAQPASAAFLLRTSDSALAKLKKKENKNADALTEALGLGAAVVTADAAHTARRTGISAELSEFGDARRREEIAHRKWERMERTVLPDQKTIRETDSLFIAESAAVLYNSGQAQPKEPDGSEFTPYPAALSSGDCPWIGIASVLATRDLIVRDKTGELSPAEEAHARYEVELAARIDRLEECFFGANGINRVNWKKEISEDKAAAYRKKLPVLIAEYRGLVMNKNRRIAFMMERLLTDEPAFKTALDRRSAASAEEADSAFREDKKRYSGKGADRENNRIIGEVISERDKMRRSYFKIRDSAEAAAESGLLGEYEAELDAAHGTEMGIQRFYLHCGESYLEQLTGGEKAGGIEGFFIRRHYGGSAGGIDPERPIIRQAGLLSADFKKLSAWDYDNKGILCAWSAWAERMGVIQDAAPVTESDESVRDAYEQLMKMKEEHPALFDRLGCFNFLQDIPAMFEIFSLAGRLLEAGIGLLSREEVLEVTAVFRTLQRRAVYIDAIAEKSFREAAGMQTDIAQTSYAEVLRELRRTRDTRDRKERTKK
ncbi:MAG: hypothetical protein K6B72_02765 [Lachnospiraceae bacterium]|nr:hypothetical protein [Lachnospiraceae bacterium]